MDNMVKYYYQHDMSEWGNFTAEQALGLSMINRNNTFKNKRTVYLDKQKKNKF